MRSLVALPMPDDGDDSECNGHGLHAGLRCACSCEVRSRGIHDLAALRQQVGAPVGRFDGVRYDAREPQWAWLADTVQDLGDDEVDDLIADAV